MSVAETTIRFAGASDVDAVAALQAGHEDADHDTLRHRIAGELHRTDRRLWVATAGGEVVAFGRLVRHWGDPRAHQAAPSGLYLGGLVVDPAHRRQGIGRRLTEHRMALAFAEESRLWSFADARNEAARALHESLGFVEITRDFSYPGVSFAGGEGILFRARRPR